MIANEALPEGTVRRRGLILSTKAKAARCQKSEVARSEFYRLLSHYPETADEIAKRVKASRLPIRTKRRAAGKEGRFELGTKQIRNPYNGEREEAQFNAKHDVLEHMHARGNISDAEKIAGDRFVGLIERSGIGGAQAIDYARVRVDGGRVSENLSESVIGATQELVRVRNCIGETGFAILRRVIVDGLSIEQLAGCGEESSPASRRTTLYLGRRFREALADLALLWGTKGRNARQPRAWLAERSTDRPDVREAKRT